MATYLAYLSFINLPVCSYTLTNVQNPSRELDNNEFKRFHAVH